MPGKKHVKIKDKANASLADPPEVELRRGEEGERLEIEAPPDSDLIVFFLPAIHLEDDLKEELPAKLKGEYAPFGGDGKVRIRAGKNSWKSPVPHKDWPKGEYPYRIYVEKKGRQAAGNSPPKVILI